MNALGRFDPPRKSLAIDPNGKCEGRKSLALSLTFLRPDRTLTQDEAVAARDAIAGALQKRLGAEVRQ